MLEKGLFIENMHEAVSWTNMVNSDKVGEIYHFQWNLRTSMPQRITDYIDFPITGTFLTCLLRLSMCYNSQSSKYI